MNINVQCGNKLVFMYNCLMQPGYPHYALPEVLVIVITSLKHLGQEGQM